MRSLFIRFAQDQKATTAIEYSLLTAFVLLVMLAGLQALGDSLDSQVIVIGSGLN